MHDAPPHFPRSGRPMPCRALLHTVASVQLSILRCLNTRALVATVSANGRIATAGTLHEVDAYSMAAVRARKEIWGVRNISRLSL